MLSNNIANIINIFLTQTKLLEKNLAHLSPHSTVINNTQQVDWLTVRLDQAIISTFLEKSNQFLVTQTALEGINPHATLARGYAIVRGEDGNLVRSIHEVSSGDEINVRVSDGDFEAEVK